jgi:hypothetical protein
MNLKNITMQITPLATPPGYLQLDLFTSACNSTIFLLDSVNVTLPLPSGATSVQFNFSHLPRIERTKNYFLFLHGSVVGNGDVVRVKVYTHNNPSAGGIIINKRLMNVTIWDNYTYPFLAENKTNARSMFSSMSSFSRDRLGIDSYAAILNMTLSQESTWSVLAEGMLLIQANDSFSSYKRIIPFETSADITNLPEPLLLINTKSIRPIKPAPFGVDKGFNISIFSNFTAENLSWERFNESPDFLYRMMNWTNISLNYGFETAYNISSQSPQNRSRVDWLYFSTRTYKCFDLWTINVTALNVAQYRDEANIWENQNGSIFDTYSLLIYNVSSLFWNTTCPS